MLMLHTCQLFALSREAITDILKMELQKKDQIKSALVVYAIYVKYTYKGGGDSTDLKNYKISYHHPYHREEIHILLSKNDIDDHITRFAREIDQKIEAYLKEESGKILFRLEMVFIESYTYR